MEFDNLPFLENIKNMAKEYNSVLKKPQRYACIKHDCPPAYYEHMEKIYGKQKRTEKFDETQGGGADGSITQNNGVNNYSPQNGNGNSNGYIPQSGDTDNYTLQNGAPNGYIPQSDGMNSGFDNGELAYFEPGFSGDIARENAVADFENQYELSDLFSELRDFGNRDGRDILDGDLSEPQNLYGTRSRSDANSGINANGNNTYNGANTGINTNNTINGSGAYNDGKPAQKIPQGNAPNHIQEYADMTFRYPKTQESSAARDFERQIDDSQQIDGTRQNNGAENNKDYRDLAAFTNTLKNIRLILNDQAALLIYMRSLTPDRVLREKIDGALSMKENVLKDSEHIYAEIGGAANISRPNISRGAYGNAYNMLTALQNTLDRNFEILVNNNFSKNYMNGLSGMISSENKYRLLATELKR
ncbi:MAG: hypothetical protein LBP79_01655 [Clostridiales bacterium]|jgi:hypothetical protein|nr:hypothetical protein [Clostridiales bacterium]